MGFGQSLNVTPIQLLTAISSYANDGKLMEPHIVKAFLDENGKPVKDIRPQVIRRVVSKETAAEVLDIMKYACEEGGAKIMHIDGYDYLSFFGMIFFVYSFFTHAWAWWAQGWRNRKYPLTGLTRKEAFVVGRFNFKV